MEFALVWAVAAIVVAVAAGSRGRSALGWFVLALVISPLLAGFLVIAMPMKARAPAPSPAAVETLPPGNAARGYFYFALLAAIAIALAVGLLAGCSSVQVIDASAPPISGDACRVKVYLTENQALKNGPIEELCVINGTSSGSFSHTVATAIDKHKHKACGCGATDVYVQSQTQSGWDVATVTLVAFRYTKSTN